MKSDLRIGKSAKEAIAKLSGDFTIREVRDGIEATIGRQMTRDESLQLGAYLNTTARHGNQLRFVDRVGVSNCGKAVNLYRRIDSSSPEFTGVKTTIETARIQVSYVLTHRGKDWWEAECKLIGAACTGPTRLSTMDKIEGLMIEYFD